MMKPAETRRPVLSLTIAILAVAAIIMVFAAGKLTGSVDDEFAKRGVAAMIGIMLVVVGNYVPKMRLFQSDGAPGAGPVDRFAGWIFVLAGLTFAAIWALAPVDRAALGSPMIAIAAFLLVLARWLHWRGQRQDGAAPRPTPGRILIVLLLLSLFWASLIFLADRLWGDTAVRWMAIVFAVALPLTLIPVGVYLGRRA